jgi:hypothetical protein
VNANVRRAGSAHVVEPFVREIRDAERKGWNAAFVHHCS